MEQKKKVISPEIQQKYMICKNQYKQLLKTILALEDEKKEHNLVYSQIEKLEDERRCYRMVGGILVERNVKEAKTAIKNRIDKELDPKVEELKTKLRVQEKALSDYEQLIGYRRANENDIKNLGKEVNTPGLLVEDGK